MVSQNGRTLGCFLDPVTGDALATGKTEIYYQLGEDGQLHPHWVDPSGYFYQGAVIINGIQFYFTEEGTPVTIG